MFSQSEHARELNILEDAAVALHEHGVTARIIGQPTDDLGIDAFLDLEWRGTTRRYDALVKQTPTAPWVATLRARVGPGQDLLLVAPRVTPAVAERCRALDVHYADAVGNAFLDWGGLLLSVEGRRPERDDGDVPRDRPLRAFQTSGLRVMFVLLCRPDLGTTYRDLAEAADVSLGTVHLVVNELIQRGYVEKRGRTSRLHQTAKMFDKWVYAYASSLEPRLVLGRFAAEDPQPWLRAEVPVQEYDAQWGGESAAALLGGYLRPGAAVVYAPSVPARLLQQYRLRRTPKGGDVVFRERFWTFDGGVTVPTPLVYADLVASGDPRQIEAARRLLESDDDLRRLDAR